MDTGNQPAFTYFLMLHDNNSFKETGGHKALTSFLILYDGSEEYNVGTPTFTTVLILNSCDKYAVLNDIIYSKKILHFSATQSLSRAEFFSPFFPTYGSLNTAC